jgi:hypothetical protein
MMFHHIIIISCSTQLKNLNRQTYLSLSTKQAIDLDIRKRKSYNIQLC